MKSLKFYFNTFGKYGIIVAFLSKLSKYINHTLITSVPVFINNKYKVFIRLRTSDIEVFREIFVYNEYDINMSCCPHIIIDAGAYTGLSSVYFAARYPDAKIIAVEPETSNFDLLLRNIKPFKNIKPIQAALWKEETELKLYDPGRDRWGYQAVESESQGEIKQIVPSVTIEKIMQNNNLDFIDILKLDIEGAEKEVFESSRDWIPKVGVLIVELHERFQKGCQDSFEASTYDFEYEEKRGEKIIRMREKYAPKNSFVQNCQ